MLQAALGYIAGQTVAVLAIAFWHLLKRWDCPCREELAGIESLGPPQPCQRPYLFSRPGGAGTGSRSEREREESETV